MYTSNKINISFQFSIHWYQSSRQRQHRNSKPPWKCFILSSTSGCARLQRNQL